MKEYMPDVLSEQIIMIANAYYAKKIITTEPLVDAGGFEDKRKNHGWPDFINHIKVQK